jgi:hypothetical protein
MTIGIGVLGTSDSGRRKHIVADTAVLIADTQGSFGDVDSHARLHKTFEFPESGVYAVVADRVECGAELMPMVSAAIGSVSKHQRTYGTIMRAIADACYAYKRDKFTICEFPKLRLPPKELDPVTVTPELNATVQASWEDFNVGCDLLIAAFDRNGRAFLFHMDSREHDLRNTSFPGFWAIGSGSENALFWLSRRQHTLGMLPLRAGYHAYEAKLMAESSPFVNEHLDVIVATNDDHWFSTTHKTLHRGKEHPDINITSLAKLFKKRAPRSTEDLGRK